ncbi:alpha/beta-hydrolase [Lophium mytilinum]|uniref:Alpha/beta-hydrolase n=1 Tax=Lophium mytilinum TaxID=390894 RepID=A0A6A6QH72_9PEZI|nr:alpha/beta-hydrolase [Lophium mytilinum]
MSSPTPPLPTIVLVHGAWHTPAAYTPFISALSAAGFTVHCPPLPSCSNTRPPPATFPDDVATVRTLVDSLLATGESVAMVMHSYGGAVGTSAITGLSTAARTAVGKPGGVVQLIYLCAYMLEAGTSIWDIVRAAQFEEIFHEHVEVAEDGSTFPRDPELMFFNDVKDAAVVEKGVAGLVRFPMSAMEVKVEGEAWREVPSTYVYTSEDYGVPGVYQGIMMERVKGRGVEVREVRVESGHSVFLRTGEMVGVVRAACGLDG